MTTSAAKLLNTVPQRDYLQFWVDDQFQPQSVARFLELSKADIAKVTGVSTLSWPTSRAAT